jgi:putative transposase
VSCLFIVSHDRRDIKYFAVTSHPISAWVLQQIREATPFGMKPDYLIHDNDSIFVSKDLQEFLQNAKITSVRTGYRSPWQNGICERTVEILRRELLDHIVPFNERHLYHLMGEYVHGYYNPHRTHQGIGRHTPIKSEKVAESSIINTTLHSEPILGGLYHYYRKAG